MDNSKIKEIVRKAPVFTMESPIQVVNISYETMVETMVDKQGHGLIGFERYCFEWCLWS